jgi:hypothetical protein
MTIKQLAREVCKHEGGKVNLSIAQVSEVLRVLADLGPEANETLWRYFKYRHKKGLTMVDSSHDRQASRISSK